jgi:hypothetical protein
MREIRTSGSTRGRSACGFLRCSPSYSTGQYHVHYQINGFLFQRDYYYWPPMNADERRYFASAYTERYQQARASARGRHALMSGRTGSS